MGHFPAFLNLEGRACLVVGAGEEARRKAAVLRSAGAAVTTTNDIAETPHRAYMVAVIATGNLEGDIVAYNRLKASAALINVVDRPSLCTFLWPALIERGPVTIAVSTGGTSPTLATLIRERIERAIPAAVGDLACLAGRLRRTVAAVVPTVAERRRFWRRALKGRAGALAFGGQSARALAILEEEARALTRRQ